MPSLQYLPIQEAIHRPLELVSRLFLQADQPLDNESSSGVEGCIRELISNSENLHQIPVLSPETIDLIPDKTLCRYRGMVQDMLEPEFYTGAFVGCDGLWHTTKYTDEVQNVDAWPEKHLLCDRKVLYCTAIPGQSDWSNSASLPQIPEQALKEGFGRNAKRERESGLESDVLMREAEADEAVKVPRNGSAEASDQNPLDAPASCNRVEKGDCVVLSYAKEDTLKVNDVVEVVGVLSKVPELAALYHDGPDRSNGQNGVGGALFEEKHATHPPTSLVPRLHAMSFTKLRGTEDLPVIAFKDAQHLQTQMGELRKAALSFLASALGDDSLAAEYILLQLISRVHSRTEVAVVGNISLGLANCPASSGSTIEGLSPFGRMIVALVSSLVPRVVGLPVGITQLNSRSWRPASDALTGRLLKAPLQLPPNTHLVLDETLMQAGQLSNVGLRNVEALKTLIAFQKVEYDYSFHAFPFPADAPVLVLSDCKPLLNAHISATVPLQPTVNFSSAEEVTAAAAQREDMGGIRSYLAMMRYADVKVPQRLSAFFEEQLVAAQQEDRSVNAEKLHTWLTLTRLLALSHGEDELSEKRWREARALEHAREQRARAAK